MNAQFAENVLYPDSLKLYKSMQDAGITPTPPTLSSVLKACAALEAISEGKQVDAQVIIHGILLNVILETVLVDFCSKCGEVENGRLVFDQMENINVCTWNSMISGYSQIGCPQEALKLFQAMRMDEIVLDKFTYPALLSGVTTEENCIFLQNSDQYMLISLKWGFRLTDLLELL